MGTPGPRGRQATLKRALRMAKRLEGLRYAPSIHLLAAEFGVSSRTIRRDFQALEEAGFEMPEYRYSRDNNRDVIVVRYAQGA